ncbi:apolipoprotein a-iv [Plakobranchus ocellatus]|uniref:Apolipoprotein a-iv n=1 Tax=Plakobranchus ocellatus TaxID=259542 RepID=A0AAV3YKM9_9GAST|nr:apolipoprotein a-iv [Plakobranchus ocellatus]
MPLRYINKSAQLNGNVDLMSTAATCIPMSLMLALWTLWSLRIPAQPVLSVARKNTVPSHSSVSVLRIFDRHVALCVHPFRLGSVSNMSAGCEELSSPHYLPDAQPGGSSHGPGPGPGPKGGECFQHFHPRPHSTLPQLQQDLSVANWGCKSNLEFCKVTIHNNKIEAHCHPLSAARHHCQNQQAPTSNTCSLDLAVSGGHHNCHFCCQNKACVLSVNRTALTSIPPASLTTASAAMHTSSTPTTTQSSVTTPATTSGTTALPPPRTILKMTSPTIAIPTTTTPVATTTKHPIRQFLARPCGDLISNCTAQMCYYTLAPTMCRKFCNLCDFLPITVFCKCNSNSSSSNSSSSNSSNNNSNNSNDSISSNSIAVARFNTQDNPTNDGIALSRMR